MIHAEILQIGDWVKYTNPPYIQVASITKKKIGYHIKPNEPRMHYVRLCEVEPIPLTPEILEKSGFGYNAMPYVQGWEQFGLTLYRGGDGFRIGCGENVAMIIDFVHQLQQALRLCGINQQIIL